METIVTKLTCCGVQRVANLARLQELSFLFLSVFKPACQELCEPSKGLQVPGGGGALLRGCHSVFSVWGLFLVVWLIGWLVCLKKTANFCLFQKEEKKELQRGSVCFGAFFSFTKVDETYE